MGTYTSGNGRDAGKSEIETLLETARYVRHFFGAEAHVTASLCRYRYFQSRYSSEYFQVILNAWTAVQRTTYERMSAKIEETFEYVHALKSSMDEYRTAASGGILKIAFGSDAWERVPELELIERAGAEMIECIDALEAYVRSVIAARTQYDEAIIQLMDRQLGDMSKADEGIRIWARRKEEWWKTRGTTDNIRFVEIDAMLRTTMIGDLIAKDLGESISIATDITASFLQYVAMLMSSEFTGDDRMSDDVLDTLLADIRRVQVLGARLETGIEPGSSELYTEVFSIQNSCVEVLESFLGGE